MSQSGVFQLTLLHDAGSDLAGQIFLEAGAPHVAPRVVVKDDPKKKHGEKQGVGVGVGSDEEIRFLSFVCVGNYGKLFNINFNFFSSYSRMGLALEDFRLSACFCLKIEKGLNSLSCGNFFPLNHLCCRNDRATSLLECQGTWILQHFHECFSVPKHPDILLLDLAPKKKNELTCKAA